MFVITYFLAWIRTHARIRTPRLGAGLKWGEGISKEEYAKTKLRFFTAAQYKAYTGSRPKHPPKSNGKKVQGPHNDDENTTQRYIENRQGEPRGGGYVRIARNVATTSLISLARNHQLAPYYSGSNGLDYESRAYIYQTVGPAIPETRDCDDGCWKIDKLVAAQYPDVARAFGLLAPLPATAAKGTKREVADTELIGSDVPVKKAKLEDSVEQAPVASASNTQLAPQYPHTFPDTGSDVNMFGADLAAKLQSSEGNLLFGYIFRRGLLIDFL